MGRIFFLKERVVNHNLWRGLNAIGKEINNWHWLVDGGSLIENPKAVASGAASPFPAPPPPPREAMVGTAAGDGEDPRWRRSSSDCVSFLASRLACTKVSTLVPSYQTLPRQSPSPAPPFLGFPRFSTSKRPLEPPWGAIDWFDG